MPADLYNPQHFLAPSTVALSDLLGNNFFHVPAYQRDYSWSEENVRALWSDVLATLERSWTGQGLPVDHRRPHFFGPIVVQTRIDAPGTVEVMDGQQRLVTFSILLSTLAEYAQSLGEEEARAVWHGSITQLLFVFVGGARRARVVLGRGQEQYENLFCANLTHAARTQYLEGLQGAAPRELKAMLGAYEFLHARLDEHLGAPGGADFDARLIRLLRTLLGLSLFLRMEVQEIGVAYEVFEGLNARGLELSQADLVKNKLFALAEQQGTLALVQAAWEATYVAIRGQSMVDLPLFLQYHHLVFHGPVRATELYDVISTTTLPATSAKDYADSIKAAAERLQQTLDAGATFSDLATRHIERIRDSLANRYALVLVIASTQRVGVDSAEFEVVLRLAHHFAFRRFIVEGASLSTYSGEVVEVARGFAGGASVADVATSLKAKSSDAAFRARFREASARTAREGFYVCEMLEHHLGSQAGMLPNPQSPSQHLEHIFPKRPAAGAWPAISPEDLELVVNRYGNLLVLERQINSSVKNKAYAVKKSNPQNRDYAHSGLKMPHLLQPYEDGGAWTTDSIERRSEDLANSYAATVWNLDP